MSSSPLSKPSSSLNGSAATPELIVLDLHALEAVFDRLQRSLPQRAGDVTRAADELRQCGAAAAVSSIEEVDLVDQILGAMRAELTTAYENLIAQKLRRCPPLDAATNEAIAAGCDETIPSATTTEEEYHRPPHNGERVLYSFDVARKLENRWSSHFEAVAPAVNKEVARLTAPVNRAILDTGRLGQLSGQDSLEGLGPWLSSEYPRPGAAVERFCDYAGVEVHNLLLAKIRDPLDRLRADRLGTELPRSVRRAIAAAKVVPLLPPDFGPVASRRRWQRWLVGSWRRTRAWGWAGRHHLALFRPHPAAPVIHDYLSKLQRETADTMTRQLSKGLPNVHELVAAGIWELRRQFLETGERDLRRLYHDHAAEIWGPELASREQHAQRAADLRTAIANFDQAVRALMASGSAATA